jgi:hypothetical protein
VGPGPRARLDRQIADGASLEPARARGLRGAEAVGPRGVARVSVLVCDGGGPLFDPRSETTLLQALWWVHEGLAEPEKQM